MMGPVRSWLLGVTAAALVLALAEALAPEGGVKKVCRLAGGLALLLAAVGPVVNILDGSALTQAVEGWKNRSQSYEQALEEQKDRFYLTIIEEETAAYVMDKARELGLECAAEVDGRAASSIGAAAGGGAGRARPAAVLRGDTAMKFQWKPPQAQQLWKLLDKYKYVLIVLAAGLALLLWPTGEREQLEAPSSSAGAEDFDLAALEEKLSQTLSQVEGAGKVTVILTVKSGMEQVPLTDRSTAVSERENSVEEKTVVINTGSGQEAVVRVQRSPVFQGAVVVSQGGDRADVRLLLTQAVAALTGLGADRITVCKGG